MSYAMQQFMRTPEQVRELEAELKRLRAGAEDAVRQADAMQQLGLANEHLRQLLAEWRKRWFLAQGLTRELEEATLAAIGPQKPEPKEL